MKKEIAKFLAIVMSVLLLLPSMAVRADSVSVSNGIISTEDTRIESDSTPYQKLIALLKSLYAKGLSELSPDDYTPDTYSALQCASTGAEMVLMENRNCANSEPDAPLALASGLTPEQYYGECTDAYNSLTNAYKRLRSYNDVLEQLVCAQYDHTDNDILMLNSDDYTTDSWARYINALNDAQNVVVQANKTEGATSLPDGYDHTGLIITPNVAITNLLFARYALVSSKLTKLIDSQYVDPSRAVLKFHQEQYTPKTWSNYINSLTEALFIEAGDGYYNSGEFRFLPMRDAVAQLAHGRQIFSALIGRPTADTNDCDNADVAVRDIKHRVEKLQSISTMKLAEDAVLAMVPAAALEPVIGLCGGEATSNTAIGNLSGSTAELLHADAQYKVVASKITVTHGGNKKTYKKNDVIVVTGFHRDKNGEEVGYVTKEQDSKAWEGTISMKHIEWYAVQESGEK